MNTRRRGFNLLEVMVAMALFLTSIMVIVNLFPISSRAIEQSRWRTQALQIAQTQLELYAARVAANASYALTNGTYASTSPTVVDVTVNSATQRLSFDQTVTISTPPSPNNLSGLHNVSVVVSYSYLTPSGSSRLEYVQAETILAAPP